MARKLRLVLRFVMVLALPLVLSACVLRSLFGNVIIVEDIGEEVNEIITTVFSDSTAAVCLDTDYSFYECTYIVDGEILTSTLYLLGEYGITGVLIDPVIVQAPTDATAVTATFDRGEGPEPLQMRIRESFYITPGLQVMAEPGTEFYILELPTSVTGAMTDTTLISATYTLVFTQTQPIADPIDPVELKVMLTGKATINEHDYYVPILPCVNNFAAIPALEIPQSTTPVNLQTAVGDLIRQGGNITCDHVAYYFENVPPPPLKTYLPLIQR
jgi:hypothetical protein